AGPSAAAPAAARRFRPGRLLQGIQPYLYLAPGLLAVLFWIYWPVVGAVQLAFYQWNLLPTSPMAPVGFANFEQLLTLPELRQALTNTAVYIVGMVPFSVVLPLAIALLLNEIPDRARNLYRVII